MKKILPILSGIALLALSSVTYAVPVTFDFTGEPNGKGDPLLYSQDGIDLTVTGKPGYAVDTDRGLGVKSDKKDNTQIDGKGSLDILTMDFSEIVDLLSVTFGSVQKNDGFTLHVDGVLEFNQKIPGLGKPTFDLTSYALSGSSFDFGARKKKDDYYIRSITVEATSVPEPAALLLMSLGLVGVGVARKVKA
jgi:hypothetical protein